MTPPYKFYVQRFAPDGTPVEANARDTYGYWAVACQEFPYNPYNELKELPKRDWKDEHGVSVFIPSDGMKLKDFDIQVKFIATAVQGIATPSAEEMLRINIRSFLNFIYGLSGGDSGVSGDGSSLAIFDEYTQVGFGLVTANKLSNSVIEIKTGATECIATFTITFHVNDPVPFKKTSTMTYLPWRGYSPNN